MKKKIVTVVELDDTCDIMQGTLLDVISRLQKLQEIHKDGEPVLCWYYNYDNTRLRLMNTREETDNEYSYRLQKEEGEALLRKKYLEQKELKELARLKAKYG